VKDVAKRRKYWIVKEDFKGHASSHMVTLQRRPAKINNSSQNIQRTAEEKRRHCPTADENKLIEETESVPLQELQMRRPKSWVQSL
jgi:hypothetical protein